DADEVAGVLEALEGLSDKDRARWQFAGLNGLAEGMSRRGTQLATFLDALPASKRPVVEKTGALLAGGAGRGKNAELPLEERLAGVRLVAHAPWATAGPALTGLLAGGNPQEIRLAAVRGLAAQARPEVTALLLKSWRAYTPAMRREV